MTIHRTWHTLININNGNFSTNCFSLFSFYMQILRTSKSIGNNTMKKMLLATALGLLITGCARRTFTVQNKPAAVAPKETITHHFFVSGIGRKKLSMQPENLWRRAENVKTETQQTFVKWIARFLLLAFILRWKRVCIAHNNCMSCPSIRSDSIYTAH